MRNSKELFNNWGNDKAVGTVFLLDTREKAEKLYQLTGMCSIVVSGMEDISLLRDTLSAMAEKHGVKQIIVAYDMVDEETSEEREVKTAIQSSIVKYMRCRWNPQYKSIVDYYSAKQLVS